MGAARAEPRQFDGLRKIRFSTEADFFDHRRNRPLPPSRARLRTRSKRRWCWKRFRLWRGRGAPADLEGELEALLEGLRSVSCEFGGEPCDAAATLTDVDVLE